MQYLTEGRITDLLPHRMKCIFQTIFFHSCHCLSSFLFSKRIQKLLLRIQGHWFITRAWRYNMLVPRDCILPTTSPAYSAIVIHQYFIILLDFNLYRLLFKRVACARPMKIANLLGNICRLAIFFRNCH